MPKSVAVSKKSALKPVPQSVIVFVCLLQVLAVALGVRCFLTYTNTLKNDPNWIIGKAELFFPGHEHANYLNHPAAVATQSLNLGAWRGYNEVTTKKTFNWRELRFRFQPTDHSYLYIIFDKSATEFSALRFSFTSLYRPAVIRAKYTGEFINQTPLPDLPFTDRRWQEVTLYRSNSETARYRLFLNGQHVTDFTATSSTVTSPDAATSIGFRGGQNPMYVDAVKLFGDNQHVLLFDNFDHQEQFWPLAGIFVFAGLLIVRVIFLLLQRYPKKLRIYFQMSLVLGFTSILVFSTALVFSSTLRDRYPNRDHWLYQFLNGQPNSANSYLINRTEQVLQNFPLTKKAHTKRVMIIGSSQIDGEGISQNNEDISSVFAQLVTQKLTTPQKKWEVIPVGFSGQNSAELLEAFKYQLFQLKPDLVIINLSANDVFLGGPNAVEFPVFKKALEEFVSLSKTQHFQLVFSAEANAIETAPTVPTHAIMAQVAKDNHLLFLQTHNYLATKTDTGILWWDYVHMTSFGYRLAAEFLFNQLEPILKKL